MGVDVQGTCRHSKQHYARILTRNSQLQKSLPQYSLFLEHTANSSRNPMVSQLVLLVESPAPQQNSRPDKSLPHLIRAPWPILNLLGVYKMLNFSQKQEVFLGFRGRKCDHSGGTEAKKNHSSQGAHLQSPTNQARSVTVMPVVVMLS